MDRGGIYCARADGHMIQEVILPLMTSNGIRLSSNGNKLYAAEIEPARVLLWDVIPEGRVELQLWPTTGWGTLLAAPSGYQLFISRALDWASNICFRTLIDGGITVIDPQTKGLTHIALPDLMTTSFGFGGLNLCKAFVTLSSTGRLIEMLYEFSGIPLNYLNS